MPMQSRTDQVHSYEFFLQRVVSGLVARESDPAEVPFRRLGWSGFGSVMVAIVVAAVFGVIGVLRGGGNTSWQDGESIIKVKGSDQIYLYFPDDEKLHPMTNLVSAQLATEGAGVEQVSARSLEGVPRGATLGIQGAPHSLPDGDDLLTDPWTICSQERSNERGAPETISVLGVGLDPGGGQPLGDQAAMVQDLSTGTYHMVWHGYRFAIDAELQDATFLALNVQAPLPVSPAWLYAVPPGDDLVPPSAQVVGEETTAVDDTEALTGHVIYDGDQAYLVDSDELVPLTPLEAEILNRADVPSVVETLSQGAEIGDRDTNETSPPTTGIPTLVPGAQLGRSLCSVFGPGQFSPMVVAGGQLDWEAATPTRGVGPDRNELADYVSIPGGTAVLVQSMSAPGASGGEWHIVNDQGLRFSLPDASVAGMLGYAADQRVQMFGGLVGLLDAGPDLDPAVARNPASGTARDQATG